MPQVLPYLPSFSEKLTGDISNQATGLINQHYQKKGDAQIFQSLQDPNLTPIQKLQMVSQLSPGVADRVVPAYSNLLSQEAKSQQQNQLLNQFFGNQFRGQVPDQPADPQNIQPSVPGNPPSRGSPGRTPEEVQAEAQGLKQMGDNQNQLQPQQSQLGQEGIDLSNPSTWPDDLLVKASGLSNSGGVPGIIGKMAEAEFKRREAERKRDLKVSEDEKKFNRDANIEEYKEGKKKLKRIDDDLTNFKRLEKLNDKDNLGSTLINRILINNDGSVKFPAGLTADAQEFVKLVVGQLDGAKETFGAKLTDLDVKTYLQRLPSLLQTKAGRERVLRDLKLVNEINKEYYESRDKILREKGLGNVSPEKIDDLIPSESKERIDKLREQFVIGEYDLNELPDPSSVAPGTKAQDENGSVFEVKEGKWVKVK